MLNLKFVYGLLQVAPPSFLLLGEAVWARAECFLGNKVYLCIYSCVYTLAGAVHFVLPSLCVAAQG